MDNEAPCQDVTNTTRFEPAFPGGWSVFFSHSSTVFVGLNLSSIALTSRVSVELSGVLCYNSDILCYSISIPSSAPIPRAD